MPSELEFMGGLYPSGGRPCIPAEMMEAALIRSAALERRRPKARAGLVVAGDLALEYDGPGEPAALWADERFRLRTGMRVGPSRVMRTRPMFPDWAAAVSVDYLPSLLDPKDVESFLHTAGAQVGVGDWRSRFGRFSVTALPAQATRAV